MELLYCLPTAESTADVISDCAVDKIKKQSLSYSSRIPVMDDTSYNILHHQSSLMLFVILHFLDYNLHFTYCTTNRNKPCMLTTN